MATSAAPLAGRFIVVALMTELRPGAKKLAARRFVPMARHLRRYGGDRVKGERKMPGCCPPQAALGSGNVHPLFPQAFEGTGLKSLPARSDTTGERNDATAPAGNFCLARFRRRAEAAKGMAGDRPSAQQQPLVRPAPFRRRGAAGGPGQMTWAEVNAALDAEIKLAITRERGGQDALDPHAWEEAKRRVEEEPGPATMQNATRCSPRAPMP